VTYVCHCLMPGFLLRLFIVTLVVGRWSDSWLALSSSSVFADWMNEWVDAAAVGRGLSGTVTVIQSQHAEACCNTVSLGVQGGGRREMLMWWWTGGRGRCPESSAKSWCLWTVTIQEEDCRGPQELILDLCGLWGPFGTSEQRCPADGGLALGSQD
jgi:hypothetical protein